MIQADNNPNNGKPSSENEEKPQETELQSAMVKLLFGAASDLVSVAFSQGALAAAKNNGPHGEAMQRMFERLPETFMEEFSARLSKSRTPQKEAAGDSKNSENPDGAE